MPLGAAARYIVLQKSHGSWISFEPLRTCHLTDSVAVILRDIVCALCLRVQITAEIDR
jgi:hypothetical protein